MVGLFLLLPCHLGLRRNLGQILWPSIPSRDIRPRRFFEATLFFQLRNPDFLYHPRVLEFLDHAVLRLDIDA